MSLYTKNGDFPTQLPNRIKLSDGRTRTDKTTFTEEEIADAGYLAVDNPPVAEYPNKLEWLEGAWTVRPPSEIETAYKFQQIQDMCKKLLQDTDYKVIKAIETGVAIDAATAAYRQELRDLYNNVNGIDPWYVEMPSLSSDE